MRVVSYNIFEGGVGRADPIAEVLLAQRADVVGLVEADDAEVLDRIAWRLGFDYVAAQGKDGRTAALLTRGRIVESVNHAAVSRDAADAPRSFLETLVEVDGMALPVGVVHLTARASDENESAREREIGFILDKFAARRTAGGRHVLMGDFNANSPTQTLVRDRLPDKTRPFFDANGDLPRRAISKLLDAGYTDALAAARPDAAAVTASFTTHQPGQRLDYVFAFGVAVADAWVEQDRLAVYASDHFPVGAAVG